MILAQALPAPCGGRTLAPTLPNVTGLMSWAIFLPTDHEASGGRRGGFWSARSCRTRRSGRKPGRSPRIELFKVLGTAGLLGLEYDPAYGGQGADHSYTVILGEELGRMGCAGVAMAIAVQNDMATPSLHRHGSHELKQRYLAPALRGEMVTAIAVTEPDAGSDVAGIRTRAVRDRDDWVINGSKLYITNGTQADWLCLLARTSAEDGYQGMSQILFPTSTPGFSVSRKLRKLGNNSPTPPSCPLPTRGCRFLTRSARPGAVSGSRCSSSRTSG